MKTSFVSACGKNNLTIATLCLIFVQLIDSVQSGMLYKTSNIFFHVNYSSFILKTLILKDERVISKENMRDELFGWCRALR